MLLFGKNRPELQVAYYDLFLGGVDISAYVYHQVDGLEVRGFDVKDFKEYAFKSDEYFIVVADKENYAEIRDVLIAGGYEPVKDFVQFRQTRYKKDWSRRGINIHEKLF